MTSFFRFMTIIGVLASLGASAVACAEEHSTTKPIAASADIHRPTPPSQGRTPRKVVPIAPMTVDVARVDAPPSIDEHALRETFRDAERAFLSCLDNDDSTGVIAFRLGVDRDGSVGELRGLSSTTYGSSEARSCIERIVGAMRLPTSSGTARVEVDVTLEVRPRHEGG